MNRTRSLTAAASGPIGADDRVLARALVQLGGLYAIQGRAQDGIDVAARALALDPADPQVERLGWIALALGVGRLLGAPAGLDRLAERLPQPAEAVPAANADLLVTRGSIGFYAGRTTAAIADLRAAISLGRRGAAVAQLDRAHFHLANLLLNSGEWDEALVHARVALSVVADERRVWMEAQPHGAISGLLASRGEWDAAVPHAKAASDTAAALGTSEAVFTARIAESNLARARDEPEGVVDAMGPRGLHTRPASARKLSSTIGAQLQPATPRRRLRIQEQNTARSATATPPAGPDGHAPDPALKTPPRALLGPTRLRQNTGGFGRSPNAAWPGTPDICHDAHPDPKESGG